MAGLELRTAFVTGGSGFVGGELLRRLVAGGCTVKALCRSDRSASAVEALGAEPVRGDLFDIEALTEGATGCDVAFHLAASTAQWGPREQLAKVNVEGTRNVVAACRRAGVRRLVHVSTEAALMAGQPLVHVNEKAPLRPESPVAYAATKAVAEQAVISANGEDLQTVVVRPCFVWGAGDTTVLPAFVDAVRQGRFMWVSGGEALHSTTHVANAVEGLVLAAEKGAPGERYFVTDGDPVPFRDFLTRLLGTQGIEIPDKSVPLPLAKLAAAATETVWGLMRRTGPPPLTRMGVWVTGQEITIDIAKAREELGYEPVKTIDQGMAELSL